MKASEIKVGKEYRFKVFNEMVKVISLNANGTVTIKTDCGIMDTYPSDLE